METFEKIENKNFFFGSCKVCASRCCDGLRGFVMCQIHLDEFAHVSKNFPIVFILNNEGFPIPVVLLTNGKEFCRYFDNFECSIYSQRPSVCKIYPLSVSLDGEVFIDTACPAVKIEDDLDSSIMVNKGVIKEHFYDEVLDNFQEKILETRDYFKKFKLFDNLDEKLEIHNRKFYAIENVNDDKYLKTHQSSLIHLDNYYKIQR